MEAGKQIIESSGQPQVIRDPKQTLRTEAFAQRALYVVVLLNALGEVQGRNYVINPDNYLRDGDACFNQTGHMQDRPPTVQSALFWLSDCGLHVGPGMQQAYQNGEDSGKEKGIQEAWGLVANQTRVNGTQNEILERINLLTEKEDQLKELTSYLQSEKDEVTGEQSAINSNPTQATKEFGARQIEAGKDAQSKYLKELIKNQTLDEEIKKEIGDASSTGEWVAIIMRMEAQLSRNPIFITDGMKVLIAGLVFRGVVQGILGKDGIAGEMATISSTAAALGLQLFNGGDGTEDVVSIGLLSAAVLIGVLEGSLEFAGDRMGQEKKEIAQRVLFGSAALLAWYSSSEGTEENRVYIALAAFIASMIIDSKARDGAWDRKKIGPKEVTDAVERSKELVQRTGQETATEGQPLRKPRLLNEEDKLALEELNLWEPKDTDLTAILAKYIKELHDWDKVKLTEKVQNLLWSTGTLVKVIEAKEALLKEMTRVVRNQENSSDVSQWQPATLGDIDKTRNEIEARMQELINKLEQQFTEKQQFTENNIAQQLEDRLNARSSTEPVTTQQNRQSGVLRMGSNIPPASILGRPAEGSDVGHTVVGVPDPETVSQTSRRSSDTCITPVSAVDAWANDALVELGTSRQVTT